MKIQLECLSRTEDESLQLVFGLPASHVITAELQVTVYATKDLEPDLYSVKIGDKIELDFNPIGGWPPLEE